MTIANARIEYGEKPSLEIIEQLNKAIIFGEKLKLNEEGEFDSYWNTFLVDLDMVPQGTKLHIQEIITHPSIQSLIRERNPSYNHKVKVSVPGNGLLNLKRVKVVLDCCTEVLQRNLDEGWCIIAACPQPDQRRPDYILGTSRDDN